MELERIIKRMETTLYQLDSKGNTKVWSVVVTDLGDRSELLIRSGRLAGTMTEHKTIISEGKNLGKSNETTHYEQALSKAESKVKLKLKKGYVSDLSRAKSSTVLGSGIPAPMLAQKYSADGSQKSSKTLEQLGLTGKIIAVQPKYDGNRCLVRMRNGKAELYTRKGDLMPVQLPHIIEQLEASHQIAELGLSEYILDGELFSEEISFNTLNGLLKRETITEEGLRQRALINYHLYDIMVKEHPYVIRFHMIDKFASTNVHIVPNYYINATVENIQDYLERFLAEGHEGLMIRQLNMPYENKRSWQLCKVKVFEDSEFKLVGLEEDKRGGFVGAFVMEKADGTRFNAGASGQSVEERTKMWNNKEDYVGNMATVEYFGTSEYGIPRFPKFKGIRK